MHLFPIAPPLIVLRVIILIAGCLVIPPGFAQNANILAEAIRTDETGLTAVHRAAKSGDIEKLRAFAAAGANLDAVNEKTGERPQHLAASNKQFAALRFLVETGKITVGAGDNNGASVLYWVARENDIELTRWLIARGAPVMVGRGWHPLLGAAIGGSPELIQYYLDLGIPHDLEDHNDYTALQLAASLGTPEAVKYLLQQGPSFTMLERAWLDTIRRGQKHSIAIMQLLSAYVKVSQDTETYQVLLNKGLIQAYASDAVDDVLDTLTKLGAQFNVEGNILHKLATPGYSSPKAIERAIKNGANPNARDSNNRTPFCWAIEDFYINNAQDVQRAIDIIDALVRNGAKVDPLDITSDNLLIQAILPGKDIFLPLVRKLCELGVNINAKTRTGDTTLSLAAERWNDATAVKILIEAGADPFERNSQGKSALDVAVELGKSEHVDALLSTTKPYLPSAIQMALRNALKKDNPVKGTLKNRYFQKIGHEKRA